MPSASTVFVDTNVLLYAQDPRDETKRRQAQSWLETCWTRHCGRISTQVLHEYYVNLRRAAPTLNVAACRDAVRRYRVWMPWTVDDATIDQAWRVQDRFSLSYWDALMVAAAQQQGCAIMLTEDLQHDLRIDRLRVANPFVVGPQLLDTLDA